ncbi:MAG: class I SAM-dependent methyltransferase [Zoogloeaceae bacterium]|nr:class I SAM-dependent methyltransferase [Zoogloeaceae bacterium]
MPIPLPPLSRQIALQFAATFLIFSAVWPFYYLRAAEWNWLAVALLIGAAAFLIARLSRQPWWWQLIHLLFVPLLWAGLQMPVSPLWFLGAFILLCLVFRGAASGRIPLYLSGAATSLWLTRLLPHQARALDLGAGIGSLLWPLSRQRPDLHLVGIENAPLPWLFGKLRLKNTRIDWRWGDLWAHSLAPYQVVYCFLSPAPMAALWEKACREMQPGSLLISKAFPIPDALPETLSGPEDDMVARLYVYRIPG